MIPSLPGKEAARRSSAACVDRSEPEYKQCDFDESCETESEGESSDSNAKRSS
jgi:hypothetical protein